MSDSASLSSFSSPTPFAKESSSSSKPAKLLQKLFSRTSSSSSSTSSSFASSSKSASPSARVHTTGLARGEAAFLHGATR
ncbi:hypothetical protein JCM8547_003129 [Rhodosporidiobolus lusitaniae]